MVHEDTHISILEQNGAHGGRNNLFIYNKQPHIYNERHKHKHKEHNISNNENTYYWQMDQLTVPTINNNKITNLYLKPGKSRHFILYFMISCYIPIITAVIGPIAHMFSIACLVNKWRMNKNSGKEINDTAIVVVLNCVSLFIGGVSNITLLLHFAKKLSYIKAQFINIIGWGLSCILLLIDIIVFICVEFDSENYSKGIGFWFAVYTCILYFLATLLLLIHLIGYKLKKYKATFNLNEDERAVMLYTFVLFLWICWGSWLYSKLLFTDRSYGVSMYALLCGALTVGFGDIYSYKLGGKIISMIYFLCSIIIIGLIITLTSQIIKNTFRSTIHLHLCERARIHQLKLFTEQSENIYKKEREEAKKKNIDNKIPNDEMTCSDSTHQTFEKQNSYTDVIQFTNMRKLHLYYQVMTKRLGFCTSLILFLVFWLFGAMVFKFSENWNYFDAVYFAFLDCLLTIGYGDFILTSASSRAFFILFALAAIPLMTSLINAVGASLSNIGWSFVKYTVLIAKKIYNICSFVVLEALYFFKISNLKDRIQTREFTKTYSKQPLPFYLTIDKEKQLQDDLDDILEMNFEINADQEKRYKEEHVYDWVEKVVRLSKDYELLSQISPHYKLSFEEWIDFFKLSFHVNKQVLHTKNFWFSSDSPIRFDTNEPRFLYLQLVQLLKLHLIDRKKSEMKGKNIPISAQLLGRNIGDSLEANLLGEVDENEVPERETGWTE